MASSQFGNNFDDEFLDSLGVSPGRAHVFAVIKLPEDPRREIRQYLNDTIFTLNDIIQYFNNGYLPNETVCERAFIDTGIIRDLLLKSKGVASGKLNNSVLTVDISRYIEENSIIRENIRVLGSKMRSNRGISDSMTSRKAENIDLLMNSLKSNLQKLLQEL